MRFVPAAMEARIHQETYVAVLNSLLRERGSKREFAGRLGVKPPYISAVLNLDLSPPKIPTPKAARVVVDALPASAEVREDVLGHIELAKERQLESYRVVKEEFVDCSLGELAWELGGVHHQATFLGDPVETRRHYHVVDEAVATALREFAPEEDMLGYTRRRLIANDVCFILNRVSEAVWHAKMARYVTENLDPMTYRRNPGESDYLTINARFAEAETYRSLGLYRESLVYSQALVHADFPGETYAFWEPAILHSLIDSIAHIPRFSITEVEYLADEARAAIERTSDEIAPLWMLSNAQALSTAYMRRQRHKRAERLLEDEIKRVDSIPLIGPIHMVKLLRNRAQLRTALGDSTGWQHFILQARTLAEEAGLSHEVSETDTELQRHELKNAA